MLKTLSQLVFVSSTAISQADRMAVFGASGRRSVGTGYWIPLREVQGLYGALTYGVQSDFVVTCSGGLFGLLCRPVRAAKRAALMSRPSWVVLPWRRSSKRDESCAINPIIARRIAVHQRDFQAHFTALSEAGFSAPTAIFLRIHYRKGRAPVRHHFCVSLLTNPPEKAKYRHFADHIHRRPQD